MPRCAVPSCYNHSGKKRKGTEEDGAEDIVFHGFPKDTQLSKLWIQKIKRTDSINIENAAVCSIHFSNDQYQRDLRNELLGLPPRKKGRLTQVAVPNKNLALEKRKAEQTILQNSTRKQRLETRSDKMELELEFINCALCLNQCPSAETRYNEEIHSQSPTRGLRRNITSHDEKDDLLKNQLRMIFLLRKILEIPQKQCCTFLEVYGDPSYWIDFCDSCLILVENAKTIFDQIILLQSQFDKLQNEIKNSIIQTEQFQGNVSHERKQGVKETIRSFFNQGISNAEMIIPKLETVDDFSTSDLKSAAVANLNSGFIQSETVDEDSLLYQQTDLNKDDKGEYEEYDLLFDETGISYLTNNVLKQEKIEKNSSTKLKGNTKLAYIPVTSLNSGDVEGQGVEEDDFSYQLNDFTSDAYKCDSEEHDPLRLDESDEFNNYEDKFTVDIKEEPPCYRDEDFNSHSEKKINIVVPTSSFPINECCDDEKGKSNNTTNHVRNRNKRKSHKCSLCKKGFKNPSSLKRHERSHSGEKSYKFNVCEKVGKVSSPLRRHVRIHTGKCNKCSFCGKGFDVLRELKMHERIHTGEKPYNCKICGTGFAQKGNLTRHERIHTGEKPYKCKICKKGFVDSSKVKKHEIIHTGEKPYKCKICKKGFVEPSKLKRHEKIHTGEKPYKCNICKKGFVESSKLKRHERVHTGEKPYKCKFYGTRFTQAGSLRKHENLHTGKKPYECKVK